MASFDRGDTLDKVIDIVVKKLNTDRSTIKAHISFDEAGVDSLDRVEILMRCEDLFGIEIADEDAEKFDTIDDLVNYIQNCRTK